MLVVGICDRAPGTSGLPVGGAPNEPDRSPSPLAYHLKSVFIVPSSPREGNYRMRDVFIYSFGFAARSPAQAGVQ